MDGAECKYFVGQVIHHKRFGYRGVIYDVDPIFQGSEEWYEVMARSRPPRDQPWYHVLVGNLSQTTYVAERNLESDESGEPVWHPLIDRLFSGFRNGHYIARRREN
ncbi:MAG: heat shock protein HspQ [SAR324 cluster bacterium]|nr:heat shock protein HspQ [SAR324 cluster bacterium]